jgi:hypothetical protein
MVEQATLDQGMFTDSLLETPWAHRSRRSWTTLTSFGVQAVAIGFLLLIPILTTVGVPPARTTVSTPISLGRMNPDPGPAPPHGARNPGVQIIPFTGRIIAPGRIPTTIPNSDNSAMSGPIGDSGPVGLYVGSGPALPGLFADGNRVVPVPAPNKPTIRYIRQWRGQRVFRGLLCWLPSSAKTARLKICG